MILSRIIPGTIAAVGVVLCQAHGGAFWVMLMGGPVWGWTISALWEAMSVWLWWDGSRRWLKWVPTVFLLFGMVYQSTAPLLEQANRTANAQETRANATATLDKMLVAVVDQERKGWKDTLDGLIARALPADSGGGVPAYLLQWLLVIPLIGFPAMYGICLVFIGGMRLPVAPRIVSTVSTVSDPMERLTKQLAERCKTAIEARLPKEGGYRGLAVNIEISQTVLNNVVNRERLRKRGKTIVGLDQLKRCAKALEIGVS